MVLEIRVRIPLFALKDDTIYIKDTNEFKLDAREGVRDGSIL